MPEPTDHYGLSRLGPADDFADDGYKYTDRDREAIDRLLYLGAESHTHTGAASTASNPADTLTRTVSDTGGSIPAGTRVYYKYTLVDVNGAESVPSAEEFVDTALPILNPAGPTLMTASTGGVLLPGNYYYVLTAYTNVNTQETKASAPAYLTVPVGTSTNAITLTFPTIPAGADGFNVYRKKPGGFRYDYLASVASPGTSYTDTGSVAEDCNRTVPINNSTNGANSVVVALTSGVVPVGYTWRLYRTYNVGAYDNSLLHWVVEETAEGSGIIAFQYTDLGVATSIGSPPVTNQAVSTPGKIQLTDAAHLQGRLPMGAISGFPFSTSFTYAGTLQVNTGKFIWTCDVPKATIISVRAILGVGSSPAATSVIVDVNKIGLSQATPTTATIFTTQANRPTISVGSLGSSLAVPDVTELLQGDGLTMDIDQVGGGATPTDQNLSVHVLMYLYGFGLVSHVWAA